MRSSQLAFPLDLLAWLSSWEQLRRSTAASIGMRTAGFEASCCVQHLQPVGFHAGRLLQHWFLQRAGMLFWVLADAYACGGQGCAVLAGRLSHSLCDWRAGCAAFWQYGQAFVAGVSFAVGGQRRSGVLCTGVGDFELQAPGKRVSQCCSFAPRCVCSASVDCRCFVWV